MSEARRPTVTASVITYNHENYIAQALDSVLMQKGDFRLDVLVGEDGSQDKTPSIVQSYVEKNKEIVRAVYNDPDDKIIINGKKTGNKNFMNNLQKANSEYIALLDGDDYWTDDKKLDKQIRFLEENKEYVACCHSAICVDSLGNLTGDFLQHNIGNRKYMDFDIYDILKKNPIPSLSVVFRNPHFKNFPDWFYKTEMADWPLHILNAKRGKVRYFHENMASYRIHGSGAWANFRADQALVLQAEISVWNLISKDPEYMEYWKYIRSLIDANYKKIIKLSLKNGIYKAAFLNIAKRNIEKNQIFDLYSAKATVKIIFKYLKNQLDRCRRCLAKTISGKPHDSNQ